MATELSETLAFFEALGIEGTKTLEVMDRFVPFYREKFRASPPTEALDSRKDPVFLGAYTNVLAGLNEEKGLPFNYEVNRKIARRAFHLGTVVVDFAARTVDDETASIAGYLVDKI